MMICDLKHGMKSIKPESKAVVLAMMDTSGSMGSLKNIVQEASSFG